MKKKRQKTIENYKVHNGTDNILAKNVWKLKTKFKI